MDDSARPSVRQPAAHAMAPWVFALYFFSGATGLAYEVLWARMITVQFGMSIFGVTATVAAFLLGLGAGCLWAQFVLAGRADRVAQPWSPRRSLAGYAAVEFLVAGYALALPGINAVASPLIDAAAGQLAWATWCSLQGVVALVLLGLPAAAIGASFPLVMRALPWLPGLTGRVYAINTAGAAAGALLSLLLMASVGWSGALLAVALTGAGVACMAYLLSRSIPADADIGTGAGSASIAANPRPGMDPRLLLAYGGAGACALILEIGWTRLYGMVLLRTEYVLAVILVIYLLGTALGSALAARSRRPLTLAIPLTACTCTLAGLAALGPFSRWMQQQSFDTLAGALCFQALALAVCTLPATAALGAWLPALARRLPGGRPAAAGSALLYGVNCLGGAIGAVFTATIGIPVLGTAGCIGLAAVLMLALGIALVPQSRSTAAAATAGAGAELLPGFEPQADARADTRTMTAAHALVVAQVDAPLALPPETTVNKRIRHVLLAALPLALGAAWMLRALPSPAQLGAGPAGASTVLFTYEDALTLNHVVAAPDGQRTLLTDLQHMDASSDPAAVALQADQARLPLLLHRNPHSVLFLGLGTGVSASGSLPWQQLERTAVEISPGAVRAAANWFAPVNGDITRHARIVHDDARHFLAATPARYDVIVGDLFHPDLAGMSNLLSVEQFARARDRLNGGGVFAQWLALNQFDRESLHTVMRSFQKVFPGAQVFLDGAHMALVGSPQGIAGADAMRAAPAALDDASTGGEGTATWLGRYWGPIAAGVGAVQSESRPVIEFQLPRLRYAGKATDETAQAAPPLADILLELLRQRPDAAHAAATLHVAAREQPDFVSAYAASELAVQSWLAELASDTQGARRLVRLAYEANPRDRWIASDLADDLYEVARAQDALMQDGVLERILRIYPAHVGALRALWERERAASQADAAAARARLQRVAPLDSQARAIEVPSL